MVGGLSSAGRAPALQAGGQRFEPARLHHYFSRGFRNLLNSRMKTYSFQLLAGLSLSGIWLLK